MAQLLASDDVRPEERVIVALADGVDFVAALFGILRRGAVVVMVNPDTTPELIRYFFDYTRATTAFVPADRVEFFRESGLGTRDSVRLYPVGDVSFTARLDAQSGDFPAVDSNAGS